MLPALGAFKNYIFQILSVITRARNFPGEVAAGQVT